MNATIADSCKAATCWW